MCSVPSRRTATLSPYQTFQRQPGWLQAEWLILEQHVLHSSNHLCQPQAMQSTTSTTRQSSVPVPGKMSLEFPSLGHVYLARTILYPWPPVTPDIPLQPHDVVQCFPATIVPRGLGREEAGEATRTPLGERCLFGKTLPPGSPPLGCPPLSANNPHCLTSIWTPKDT
ncbi:hypothetical protein CesoFtcFv8_012378 [Champsocephalus esox]|uniref:Uncharacterized protein n=1 Tax=Champsocephalus esox TaxID=159716 RepID=A0AAN8GTX5_9TELE|nr:hypothetical protein CesoFtcFv8_012378 [Champsocephalus esox]